MWGQAPNKRGAYHRSKDDKSSMANLEGVDYKFRNTSETLDNVRNTTGPNLSRKTVLTTKR